MNRQDLLWKFRGTLLGVAVGDALGAPFEGAAAVAPADLADLDRDPGPLRYTDDTHMTLGLARSLIERPWFDGAHLAETFARNYNAEPWRGYGAGPPQIFRLLEQGVSWQEAGWQLFNGAGSFGNGAAMRVAPVALLEFSDLERVAWLARESGKLTHTHERALEGAVLQAVAIATLVAQPFGLPLDRGAFLSTLRDCIRLPVYARKLDRVESLLGVEEPVRVVTELGNGIAADEAVPAALFAFLQNSASFHAVVTCAIGLGGDTDTIASMAGALAGAYLSEAAIPARWRDAVEGAAELRVCADDLCALATTESTAHKQTRWR